MLVAEAWQCLNILRLDTPSAPLGLLRDSVAAYAISKNINDQITHHCSACGGSDGLTVNPFLFGEGGGLAGANAVVAEREPSECLG